VLAAWSAQGSEAEGITTLNRPSLHSSSSHMIQNERFLCTLRDAVLGLKDYFLFHGAVQYTPTQLTPCGGCLPSSFPWIQICWEQNSEERRATQTASRPGDGSGGATTTEDRRGQSGDTLVLLFLPGYKSSRDPRHEPSPDLRLTVPTAQKSRGRKALGKWFNLKHKNITSFSNEGTRGHWLSDRHTFPCEPSL